MRRVLIVTATVLIAIAATCLPAGGTQPDTTPQTQHATTTPPTTAPDWPAVIRRQRLEAIWWAEVRKQQAYARLVAYAAAVAAARYPHGLCGGDLPPCRVLARESGGDIRIWNGRCYAPTGWRGLSPCGSSSASGKWQAIRSSWAGFGGYVNAADAPEKVQDDWARKLYDHGRGGSHWGL